MKRLWMSLMLFVLFFGLVVPAHAELINRGGGMIYSTDMNVTWLQNANAAAGSIYDDGISTTDGKMSWDNAVAWAGNLVYGGYDDWRIASFDPDNPDARTNPTLLHEMGYLSYDELGNPGNAGNDLQNTWPFINLPPDENQEPWYWSGTEGTVDPVNTAWRFDFWCG